MKWIFGLLVACVAAADAAVVYEPAGDGPGKGKHIVFLSGDEEYRSEEGLPMLAKILSQRHGFKCTVLFALDPDGTINPDNAKSLAGADALDSADAIVMLLRFRDWPDEQMKHFADAYQRGVPIVALRTSTHAFKIENGAYKNYNNFGKRILGEGWVNHWGKHKSEATRGIIEPSAKDQPILRGVDDVFADSDVYEAYPPADAKILLRGQVLSGMKPTDPPADYKKQRTTDKQEQGINDPMMPIAWTREFDNKFNTHTRLLTTTMGAATDLQSEGLRRLIVNGVYWCLKLDVPAKADVTYVGEYKPTMYGFKGFVKGVKPADHALPVATSKPAASTRLDLKPNDHIALIGNALGDRMQHHGHLETLIHAAYPKHHLVFRNLAVAGDEITTRHRSDNFGTPEAWLTKVKADVVLAFFGFNESFKGDAGVPQFRADVEKLIRENRDKGRRLVLVSPIAVADNPNVPKYAAAMADVAAKHDVPFVDLLKVGKLPTVYGVYLTEEGDRQLAPHMFEALFHEPPPAGNWEKLRAAVNEKNAQWHARYRTVDGYNVYGGRSQLAFPSTQPGVEITNYHVMQEEMSQRDVLTANRDKRVWSIAQGRDEPIDDSNLPAVSPVPTNKPGDAQAGAHTFLSGEAAIAKMKPHAGTRINLFASEEQFPDLVNPVQMAWDTRGRLWVSAWRNYPERTPTSTVGDKLIVLEDTDHDGHADKQTVFFDDLNCPTGIQFYKDGVLVMQAPDLWFVRDTDGDGRADWKERVLMGMDSADTHHTANSLVHEPGGAIYLSDGIFHRTQVETAAGVVRNNDAAIYRFEPLTGKFETYIAYGFANPHGRVFDYWGNDIVTDATGNNTYFGPAFSGRLDYPDKHSSLREFWNRPSRPSPGTGLLTSRHFPEEFQGNLLNLNVIGFQGIYRVKVIEDGAGLRGERLPDLVSSDDPNFRPTAVNVGPDGAVYFADWHNPIIGHMQHHIRDPNRDHAHGRIYRMTYEGRPLLTPKKIDGQPIDALLELLKEPENQVREWAKIELGKRDSARVIDAVKRWTWGLDSTDPAYAHHMTEALWVHQWHDAFDRELLQSMLSSRDPHARAAATRVLCYWRDRAPDALPMLEERAHDPHPRVRLEAVRAASFFRVPEAAYVALAALNHPTDYYIDYVIRESIRQLEPQWRDDLDAIANSNRAGFDYLLRTITTPDLLKRPLTPAIAQALLARADVADADRHKALAVLSEEHGISAPAALLDVLDATGDDAGAKANVVKTLPQFPPRELKPLRSRLSELATTAKPATVRQYAWAALATADEGFGTIWDADRLDVIESVPLVYDPFIRARAYEKVIPLLLSDEPVPPLTRQAGIRAAVSISRDHARTFAALANLILRGEEIPAAASALRSLPRSVLTPDQCAAIAPHLLSWARAVPVEQRTSAQYLATVQFTEGLVTLLPPLRASEVLNSLRDLRVAVFVVGTVREQMRYDTPRLVVEANKPFEITFENTDMMPHNLTIVKPGARKRIGELAMKMKGDARDEHGRAYVPVSSDILAATKMLETGQRETLKLTAPDSEGDYEYVCTYPEHWQVMWGKLVVTKDIDAYLRTHPDKLAPAIMPATTRVADQRAHQHH